MRTLRRIAWKRETMQRKTLYPFDEPLNNPVCQWKVDVLSCSKVISVNFTDLQLKIIVISTRDLHIFSTAFLIFFLVR